MRAHHLFWALASIWAPGLATAAHESAASNVQDGAGLSSRARGSATLSIQARPPGGAWTSRHAVYPMTARGTSLRTREISGGEPRWFMIFADLTRNYANANHPWMENPYSWTGVDHIAYHRVELTDHRGKWRIEPFDGPTDPWKDVFEWLELRGASKQRLSLYRRDIGTFWFQVEVDIGDKTLRSRGIEDSNAHGISKRVTRVSVRGREGLLGHIASYFNVPGVFGSLLVQSENHVGVDCADVLMAAWSRWKRKPLVRNHNVQMMVTRMPKRAKTTIAGGVPAAQLVWGKDVFEGDFIAVRYGDHGNRYHHVGALWADADLDGILGGEDLVAHAGPDPLHLSALESGAFDGHVVILKASSARGSSSTGAGSRPDIDRFGQDPRRALVSDADRLSRPIQGEGAQLDGLGR